MKTLITINALLITSLWWIGRPVPQPNRWDHVSTQIGCMEMWRSDVGQKAFLANHAGFLANCQARYDVVGK